MNDDTLDRIIQAAGGAPADLDRDQLRQDLDALRSLHHTGVDLRHQPTARRQRNADIIAAATHLIKLIEGDLALLRYTHTLQRLIADAEKAEPAALLKTLGVSNVSAFENLVKMGLRSVFEQHFRETAGYTTDWKDGKVRGGFVDFAEAALTELGIDNDGTPYSRQSIAKALRGRMKQT